MAAAEGDVVAEMVAGAVAVLTEVVAAVALVAGMADEVRSNRHASLRNFSPLAGSWYGAVGCLSCSTK